MADIKSELHNLRQIIVGIVSSIETGVTIPVVCQRLGLPSLEVNDGSSKSQVIARMVSASTDQIIISVSKKILFEYPSSRGKPKVEDRQIIQDALWWIESGGRQQISNVLRFEIAERMEEFTFWGRSTGLEDFFTSAQTYIKDYFGVFAGNDGFLYQDKDKIVSLDFLFLPAARHDENKPKHPPVRINILSFLKAIGYSEWPDQRFILFLERVVHPEVQKPDVQKRVMEIIGSVLEKDGFEFWIDGLQGGSPVYRVRKKGGGVQGPPRYIIFAPLGIKPDIVLADAVSMEIQIVGDPDKFVIYDQPPPIGDLTWDMLVEWWCKKNLQDSNLDENRRKFGRRLIDSLQSEPEIFLFETYFKVFRPRYGANLPALIPQVYLHYDPRSQRQREKPVLFRQRMDFLMVLRNATRIVIEIDGAQHYSDSDGKANTRRYAEMVAEDRRIGLLGYEVYRFGGAEFVDSDATTKVIVSFFNDLLERHDIHPENGEISG